jgi:hypothetical protein
MDKKKKDEKSIDSVNTKKDEQDAKLGEKDSKTIEIANEPNKEKNDKKKVENNKKQQGGLHKEEQTSEQYEQEHQPQKEEEEDEKEEEEEEEDSEKDDKKLFPYEEFREFQSEITENEFESWSTYNKKSNTIHIYRSCCCFRWMYGLTGFFKNFCEKTAKQLSILCSISQKIISIILLLWNVGVNIRARNEYNDDELYSQFIPPLDFQYAAIFLVVSFSISQQICDYIAFNRHKYTSDKLRHAWSYLLLKHKNNDKRPFDFPFIQSDDSDTFGLLLIVIDILTFITGATLLAIDELAYSLLLMFISSVMLPFLLRWFISSPYYINENINHLLNFVEQKYQISLSDQHFMTLIRENEQCLYNMRKCLFD